MFLQLDVHVQVNEVGMFSGLRAAALTEYCWMAMYDEGECKNVRICPACFHINACAGVCVNDDIDHLDYITIQLVCR